jgi:hypothetical protein
MNFSYGGENSWIDHINPTGTGFLIFHDDDDGYNCGVANDAGIYRTVGTSFELGLLIDGTGVSTRAALCDSIMKFFGCYINPGVKETRDVTVHGNLISFTALYPNPVVDALQVSYVVITSTKVSVEVFDAAGRLVRTLADGAADPGYHSVLWDGKDAHDRTVSAGVYFVHFNTDEYRTVEKAILLR